MGSPRTGSTWLLNLLSRVAGAPMVDEPLIGAHLGAPVGAVAGRAGTGADERLADVFADRAGYFFAEQHAGAWAPALGDLVVRRLRAGLPSRSTGPVLVKEPNGSAGAAILLRGLPRSRLVFLVRDGRDVVDSFLDGVDGGWISDNLGVDVDTYGGRRAALEVEARRWVRAVEAVAEAYEAHDPARRRLIRYEDLRAATADVVGQTLAWLDVDADRERVAGAVEDLSFERIPAERRGPGRFVRAATPGLWRERFDEGEQQLLDDVMGPTLDRFGYR